MNNKPVFDYPLFAMGFRTFFALAGISALAFIALWNAIAHGANHFSNYFPASVWHAHEMLLGYATAVLAGFLLTAVKNWTGRTVTNPDQLAALALLWLYGRIAPFYAQLLPDSLIAALDLAFLPSLAYVVSKPLLQAGDKKNLLFVGLLLGMAVANGMIHAEMLGLCADGVRNGLTILVTIMVMMMIYMAGRIFPFFTERGLSGVICIRNPLLDLMAVLLSLLVFILLLFDVSGPILAVAAVAAVVINLVRVGSWYDHRIWYVPLLWILYIGYGWIILGFGLVSLAAFAWVPQSIALHAFTVGGIGVLTLGMMARVALGHTGRVLKASNLMAFAFLLINLAAVFRVLFPVMLSGWYSALIWISGYCWLAAFALFMLHYLPILGAARVDGKAG